jgi:hypothetical protein
LEAAGYNGVPILFIVNEESKIAWINVPFEMAKPFDLELEKFRKRLEASTQRESMATLDRYYQFHSDYSKGSEIFLKEKDSKKAVEYAEQLRKNYPEYEYSCHGLKLRALVKDPNANNEAVQFVEFLYGRATAQQHEFNPKVPRLDENCMLYASILAWANRDKPNRFYLEAAERFARHSEKLLKLKQSKPEYAQLRWTPFPGRPSALSSLAS